MGVASIVEMTGAAVGVMVIILGGVYGLGKFKSTMDANTKSNEKLATVIDSHLIWAQAQVDASKARFENHEVRITVLEHKK